MLKSSELCRSAGCTYSQLRWLIQRGTIAPKARDGSGDFLFDQSAVDEVKRIRAAKEQLAAAMSGALRPA